MNVKLSFSRTAALVAGLTLGLTGLRAAEADAIPSFETNYIKFSGVAASMSGSNAGFQRREQILHQGAAGIEALNYGYDLSKETNLQIDAKALPGAEDYLAQFKVTKNEVGSFEAGYKRFRTYYDGAGGFFPTNNAWIPLYPRSLYVDRAKFFAGAKLEMPKAPVFEFKYTNELRNGRKDSTIWGDSDFTGIPIYSLSSLNPVTSTRKILPAYIQLGERQQTWEASVHQTFGETTASFAIIGSKIDNLDSRSVDRYTGELKPFPAIPSNPPTLVNAALANNPNKGFDVQGFNEDATTYVGKIETKLSAMAELYAEASYRKASGNNTGNRLIYASLNTGAGPITAVGLYTAGGRPPYSYTSAGSLNSDTYTGVVGVRLAPLPNFNANVAVRAENYKVASRNTATYQNTLVVQATGVSTPVPVSTANATTINEKPWTPEVDLRYTGIAKLPLYVTWDYRSVTEDEKALYGAFSVNTSNGSLTGPINPSFDKIKEKHSNLKVGANWSPNSMFSLRPEFFTKDHENRFDGYGISAGDYYILDYDIYGARISAIVKPMPTLTFNTRYVVQRGKAEVDSEGYGSGTANDSRRYQLCETVNWAPNKAFYVQANINKVWDTIVTSYPIVTGAAQAVVHNADNNYWNGSLVAIFSVDKETDASIEATYYKANNYNPALAATTEPFGASGREYSVAAGLKRKFNDKWVGSAKVGYVDSHNATTGGNTDFRGPLAYLSLEHAF